MTDDRRRAELEFGRLKRMLDDRGIDHESHERYVTIDNGEGECWVFPSQTFDGKLCVRYVRKGWVKTADEALELCGVTEYGC